ncbi:hypothetical protein [Flavobacterium sp. 3HN19-14]|uniref:hypothetical protein n=1 Tax=Flavobacterium sp. 3HN19-14 TaxID=3448133 RepID=UPI003EE08DF6
MSFFTHFPSLTVSLDDLSLTGSAPYRNDTLLKARQVAFGINLMKLLFSNEVKIDKLYVSDAFIDVKVNEKERPIIIFMFRQTSNRKTLPKKALPSGSTASILKIAI